MKNSHTENCVKNSRNVLNMEKYKLTEFVTNDNRQIS